MKKIALFFKIFNFVFQSTFIMTKKDYLRDISEIKEIMNRSTRFISLSGISGILAGVYALIGGIIAYNLLSGYSRDDYDSYTTLLSTLELKLICIAIVVATLSCLTGYILTKRIAHKNNEKMWTPASKQLLTAFSIPMVTGGVFALLLLNQGYYGLIAPVTLIFYGLSLINASKYTLSMVRYLGLLEVSLGLVAMLFIGKGLFFWIVGFGILHILYGTLVYFKLDSRK